ncbi:MAG: hypothetical protein ABIQ66_03095 [Novosphingobium sp.]
MKQSETADAAVDPAILTATAAGADPVAAALTSKLVPLPFVPPSQWWKSLLGPALSLAIIVAVLVQLRKLDWHQVWSVVPSSPLIWTVLAAGYFVGPFADWLIFRRLWAIPAGGFFALVRKTIGNEILLGYIGEVYFYDWARRRANISASPFGAVKDVAILSALAGNAMTLIMMIIAWPLLSALELGREGQLVLLSLGIVLLSSMAIMALRNRLLSLPKPELRFVFAVHCARIVVGSALLALAWHLILPGAGFPLWLMLSTIRMIISRLPLIPNKDIVFAGAAAFLVGHSGEIPAMMAMIATLTLAVHVILGLGLMSFDLIDRRRTA